MKKNENIINKEEFMKQWGIVEEDVCILMEDDPEFQTEETMEAVIDG